MRGKITITTETTAPEYIHILVTIPTTAMLLLLLICLILPQQSYLWWLIFSWPHTPLLTQFVRITSKNYAMWMTTTIRQRVGKTYLFMAWCACLIKYMGENCISNSILLFVKIILRYFEIFSKAKWSNENVQTHNVIAI